MAKKAVQTIKFSPAEAYAKAYFEWLGGGLWAEGMWEELSEDTQASFVQRMQDVIERVHLA